jgi:hypothetical protein
MIPGFEERQWLSVPTMLKGVLTELYIQLPTYASGAWVFPTNHSLQCSSHVIQNLTHHVRTAFGDSAETYGPHAYTGFHPNQGILQRNGAAILTWTAISSVIILLAMRSLGFGYSSWSAISCAVLKILCVAFVDDTDIVNSGPTNDTTATQVHLRRAFSPNQFILLAWAVIMFKTNK